MAITIQGMRALEAYAKTCDVQGPLKEILSAAVKLTNTQQWSAQALLRKYWGRTDYTLPFVLPIKPHHGYLSRVINDKFASSQYVLWLSIGCADDAIVESDEAGRPRLVTTEQTDFVGCTYRILVPFRSDSHGHVHFDGVIPDGLPKGAQKKAALSAIP